MTSQANQGLPSVDRHAFVVPLDPHRAKAFRKAYNHSRMVRILRIALPSVAVFLLTAFLFTSNLTFTFGDSTASVDRVEISDSALRMINPKMEGATGKNGKYKVTADYAEQDISKPDTLRLNTIKAEMLDAKKAWSRLTAPKGTFYTKDEKLDLFGNIEVTTSKGMSASLKTATMDMKSQIMRSHDPVVVRLLNGTVHANTLEIRVPESRVFFRDKVRVHMRKRPANKLVKAE